MGTLGAGNHYAEIQVVDEIHDEKAASKMGLDEVGQVRGIVNSSHMARVHWNTGCLKLR